MNSFHMTFTEEEVAALVAAVEFAEGAIQETGEAEDPMAHAMLLEMRVVRLKLQDALFWKSKFPPQQEMRL